MEALENTKWSVLHHSPDGQAVHVQLHFMSNDQCTYGPYNGSYNANSSNFSAKISVGERHLTDLQGVYKDGSGHGTMTNPPIERKTPFVMFKIS